MVWFVLIAVYVAAALVVAHHGQDTRARYFGTFLLSLVLTPVIIGLMLLAFGEREPKPQ